MSSKRTFIILISVALLFSGCSDFLKSKKANDEVITFEDNEACLKHFPIVFDKFLDSKIDKAEIDEALICLTSTLTRFQNKFRGQEDKNIFSVEDITTIFNFFFRNLKISSETSEKLIRFKYALIGGDAKSLSKVDIENLKEFLKDLSEELKNISQWIAVFRSDGGQFSSVAIKSAYGQLRISLNNLINSGHISKNQYSIEDFILLLKQFNFNLKSYSDQIQQLLIIKKMFIDDNYVKSKESYIAAIELLMDVMQANSMVENNHYQFKMNNPETKKNLTDLVGVVLHIFKNSPLMKSDQFIKLQSVKKLVKFGNKMLSYENLLTIKVIVFGGTAEILTAQEVAQFETKSQGLIDSAFQISNILNQKSFKDFISIAPQLQSQINFLSEKTFIDTFLASSEHAEKIYKFIENYLTVSGTPAVDGGPNYKIIFNQLADAATFSSKENIQGFLKGLTALYNQLDDFKVLSQQKLRVELGLVRTALDHLDKTIAFKKNPTIDLLVLLTQMQIPTDQRSSLETYIKIVFPKMKLSELSRKDLQALSQFFVTLEPEIPTFMRIPIDDKEFEELKKSLKRILSVTDFYSNAFRSHQVMEQLLNRIEAAPGDEFKDFAKHKKNITSFLNLLIANREIRSFDDINSMLNSAFAAFQLYKKTLSAETGFSFSFLQDVSSLLLVSDAMRINKSLEFADLLKVIEATPQSAASSTKVKKSLNYLKLIFPKINSGKLEASQLQMLVVFTRVLAEEKTTLSAWPTTHEQIQKFKNAAQHVLSETEFYSGEFKSHQILTDIIEALYEGGGNSFDISGLDKMTILQYMNLLIANRKIVSFDDIESILNTVFASLEFYNNSIKSNHAYDAGLFHALIRLILSCDQMQNEHYVRFDLIVGFVEKLAGDYLKKINLTAGDLIKLKANFFEGDPDQLNREDLESLTFLLKLFESKNTFSAHSFDVSKLIKFFTTPESVKRLFKMFSPDSQQGIISLSQLSIQIFKIAATSIKLKSEFDGADSTNAYSELARNVNRVVDEISQIPLFMNNQTLDLRELQKVLKDSLDIDLPISDFVLKMKIYVLGGDPYLITKNDLNRVKQVINYFHSNEKEFYAALKVFHLDSNLSFSMEQVDKAGAIIKEKLKGLLVLTKLPDARMNFADVLNLQRKLINNLTLNKFELLIAVYHKLLVGDHFNYSIDHFNRLINTYVDGLKVVRFSQLGFARQEINGRENLMQTMATLNALLGVFENSITFSVDHSFEVKYFDSLLTFLVNGNYILPGIKAPVFLSFYKKMFNTVFTKNPIKLSDFSKITSEHLLGIKSEFILFNFYLKVLDEAVLRAGTNSTDLHAFNAKLKSSMIESYEKLSIDNQDLFVQDPQFFAQAKQSYLSEMKGPNNIVFFAGGYVVSPKNYVYLPTWSDYVRAHYMKTLARLLVQGWGSADRQFIEASGLIKWYNDFKEFGIAVKAFDPRTGNSGERSMIEANLFTVSGDGDNRMNFIEATQFVSLLMTGGARQFNRVYLFAEQHKCLAKEKDPLGYPFANKECILSVYTQYYERIFSNIDWFVHYLKKMESDADRTEFFKGLMAVAMSPSSKPAGQIESIDIKTMNMILMYVESVFLAFDEDQNSLISTAELRKGYSRFDNLIFHIAKKKSGADLKSFTEDMSKWICRPKNKTPEQSQRFLAQESFIYLIYNGRLPEQNDMLSFSGIGNAVATAWNCARNDLIFTFTGEVDRKMMINTFKLMKSVLASE